MPVSSLFGMMRSTKLLWRGIEEDDMKRKRKDDGKKRQREEPPSAGRSGLSAWFGVRSGCFSFRR